MPAWFGKKPEPKTSPGGSVIYRHPAAAWLGRRSGPSDEAFAKYAEARQQVYSHLFGEPTDIYKDALPGVPSVDVHTYLREHDGQRSWTLATSGMSDLPMDVPAGANIARRVELIFYCAEPKQEYCEVLQWLAHFPHDQKTWVGWGATVPNGNPPAPFWGSSILDTILFLTPVVKADQALPQELSLDGEAVSFLWVVPLTTPECNLKLEKNTNAILRLFQQNRHPYVFDPNRKSYV